MFSSRRFQLLDEAGGVMPAVHDAVIEGGGEVHDGADGVRNVPLITTGRCTAILLGTDDGDFGMR